MRTLLLSLCLLAAGCVTSVRPYTTKAGAVVVVDEDTGRSYPIPDGRQLKIDSHDDGYIYPGMPRLHNVEVHPE